MKPTVGRIVHYRQPDNEPAVNGTKVHAAIVTRVWSDSVVNLQVFFDSGPVEPVTSVEVERPEEEGAGRRWFWPPRE